ncbi:primary-amine oxidase [Salinifilum ghardaiensis]
MTATRSREPSGETPVAAAHPLTPLRAEEIERATTAVKTTGELSDRVAFVSVTLVEPAKADVDHWEAGDPVPAPRRARVVLRDRGRRKTVEATVAVESGAVEHLRVLPGVQPAVTAEEFDECEQAVKQDPRWQEALRKRGITNPEDALVDPWSAGHYQADDEPDTRRLLALTWVRSAPGDNAYAHPVEGLITVFDLDELQVLDVEDHGVVPVPPKGGNYEADKISREDNFPRFDSAAPQLEPLDIVQPEGPSFSITDRELTWANWSFVLGWTAREGLVLHRIRWRDGDDWRPVVHRASITDLFVPYGDPAPTHWRKNAFDSGEYGLGVLANSLERGCDCLGEIRYLDAVNVRNDGTPATVTNAICIHEEDFGILWKHLDLRTGRSEVRRSRRLVVSFIATVANYEYAFYWYFYLDGTLECQVKLTGIISTGAVADGQRPRFGTLVAPGLYGPNHQHFVSARLDMEVDGRQNTVHEVDPAPQPVGVDNPRGNAWIGQQHELARESQAQRLADPLAGRYWKIENSTRSNALGTPVSYKLTPTSCVRPLTREDNPARRRATFISRHLWVSRYHPDENFAAGDYPNQREGSDGIADYVQADRGLVDTDVVLWHTFGTNHIVRPEDWPVMPVEHIGFTLSPVGFHAGNPALNLPASSQGSHTCHQE